MKNLEEYISELLEINPAIDIGIMEKAYLKAKDMHEGQLRKSMEPYLIHPIEVSLILASLGMDERTLVAGLLHDAVEDTPYSIEDLKTDFGGEVALLVDGVTKLTSLQYESQEEKQAENLRKMFLAMSKDIRVIIIKLADRLHNLRTINYMSEQQIYDKCRESIEIYAPLASRLGMHMLKFQLEDISFEHLYPEEYTNLKNLIEEKEEKLDALIDEIIAELRLELDSSNIDYDISGRRKHLYSIYRKMKQQNKKIEDIFDLTAVRVIVNTKRECYLVLSIVNDIYNPIDRIKDYIATPKPNGYRSLHSTVVDQNGQIFEVQIRTREMHRLAEYGIAAHWKYKEGINEEQEEAKLGWLRQTLDLNTQYSDPREFMNALRVDLFSNQVFVFTPLGEIIELPAGSTPLDFAFKIHTDIGVKYTGAKVNGKIVKINYELQNGELVEVLTSNNAKGPSLAWRDIVKSSHARTKINSWLKKHDKLEKTGKSVEKEIVKPKDETEKRHQRDDIEAHNKSNTTQKATEDNDFGIEGTAGLLVRLARCCSSVPGDDITGYITKGKGITVHRQDCPNIISLPDDEKNRLIDLTWSENINAEINYDADIFISATDRKGLFSDISRVMLDLDINMSRVESKTNDDNSVDMEITVRINNASQINLVIARLKMLPGIDLVSRAKA
jgi:GTP pyrophosphokinase